MTSLATTHHRPYGGQGSQTKPGIVISTLKYPKKPSFGPRGRQEVLETTLTMNSQYWNKLITSQHGVQEAKFKNRRTIVLFIFAKLPMFKISAQTEHVKALFGLSPDGRTDGQTHTRLVVFDFSHKNQDS
jgi:hypothetical protein